MLLICRIPVYPVLMEMSSAEIGNLGQTCCDAGGAPTLKREARMQFKISFELMRDWAIHPCA